jgi:hypothetical protein
MDDFPASLSRPSGLITTDHTSVSTTSGLVFTGETTVTTVPGATRVHTFKFTSQRPYSLASNNEYIQFVEVIAVHDQNYQDIDLVDICHPETVRVNADHRFGGARWQWFDNWNYAWPSPNEEPDKTDFVFRWRFRGTDLHRRQLNEAARDTGETHVSKNIYVTFKLYSQNTGNQIHTYESETVRFVVRMHRIGRRTWKGPGSPQSDGSQPGTQVV